MATANLITLTDPRSAAAEAFRTLRTNLMFSSVENPIRTLLVTSPARSEGKSVALANLAVTFAQAGHKTILVDADMRQPQQHEIWGVPNRGLTTMMIEDAALAEPPLAATSVNNLFVLPAGADAPNPADLLSSQRMNEIIGVLKARAAYVFFDSPPVHDFTFTPAISLFVDFDDEERLKQVFERLSEKGQVAMPLGDYGFSPLFGWVQDRFGVSWQLNLKRDE